MEATVEITKETAPIVPPSPPLVLDIRNLSVSFHTDEGLVTAVNDISLQARKGRTLGLVGESGSGKSVSTRTITKLLPKNAVIGRGSKILLDTGDGTLTDVAPLTANSRAIRMIRGGAVAMIFQEPMASFSPVYTIGNQIAEAVRLHRRAEQSPLGTTEKVGDQIAEGLRAHDSKMTRKQAKEIAIEMMDKVGISNAHLRIDQYPHEFSGGMRQRAMIAAALAAHPTLLVADEPTTALDVTIQAQILELMAELQGDLGMSIIFITHDMGVIARVAHDVAVMYLGEIVERGPTRDLVTDPKHPYTEGLLRAIPRLDVLTKRLTPVPGDIPSPLERPAGCPFHTRCPKRIEGRCDRQAPREKNLGGGRFVSCFLHG